MIDLLQTKPLEELRVEDDENRKNEKDQTPSSSVTPKMDVENLDPSPMHKVSAYRPTSEH